MEISYPDVSLVCGSEGNRNMKGKAKGEPKHQMARAKASTKGVMISRPSAHTPKTPFNPHPPVQQSGQTVSTAPEINS